MNEVQSQNINQEKLVARLRSGNPQAIEQLYDHYSPVVYGIAFNMTKSEASAEKILKETFLHAWKDRSTFNPDDQPVWLWLISVMRKIAQSQISFDEFLKKHNNENRSESKDVHTKNEEQDLLTAVNTTTIQKKVFELTYIGGGKINEVAKHLSIDESEVKKLLREAISRNRKKIHKA